MPFSIYICINKYSTIRISMQSNPNNCIQFFNFTK